MRFNCTISLEYFSVIIYFYGRKSREIRSLLSLVLNRQHLVWLVAAVFPSLPPAPPPARSQKKHNTLIRPPTSVLSFPRSCWECCAQCSSSSAAVVLDKKKRVWGGCKGICKGNNGFLVKKHSVLLWVSKVPKIKENRFFFFFSLIDFFHLKE